MKENEMYPPLKGMLAKQGYHVHAEVEGCDVIAQKDNELVIIEMKISFNMQLVYQLIERLKMTDLVYAYVPLKKGGRWAKSYKRMCGLLKRLHCGLITYHKGEHDNVVVEFHPTVFKKRTNYIKKNLALKELAGRSIDLNVGGSTRQPVFTAYKEKAIRIAMYLFEHGPSSTKDIRNNLEINKSADILSKNYLGWFERASHGVYQLSPEFEFFRLEHKEKINQLWR